MKTAFVLMPFAEEFDDIYSMFIFETLSEAGFQTIRADDIASAQNILKDIVTQIQSSDLIIADLSLANPNVFYELGIAHTFKKPVIMLTQDIKELPFDLRPYRTILYSTDFVKIREAREQLLNLARSAFDGSISFGNPVMDFSTKDLLSIPSSTSINTDDHGLLDFLADFEDANNEIVTTLSLLTCNVENIGITCNDVTTKLGEHIGSASEKRSIIRGFASKMNEFASSLKYQNKKYLESLSRIENSLDNLLTDKFIQYSAEYAEGIHATQTALSSLLESITPNIDQTKGFVSILSGWPEIEQTLSYAQKQAVIELNGFIQSLEKTAAVHTRAIAICKDIILRVNTKLDNSQTII